MSTSTTKALIAGAFITGGLTTLTAKQLFGGGAEAAAKFQNQHSWVARKNPDGGVVPIYAGRSCGYLPLPDAGVGSSICSYDGAEFSEAQAKSFELFLKSLGITPPR